jgi:dGTPase
LTHALKVAQVGRRIAENLIKDSPELRPDRAEKPGFCVDPDVVEAAGLAHDLGHPPFGHIAEEELNGLALAHNCNDGFEGNAQSFRIVTSLEVRSTAVSSGLDLTRATLNAVLKYPWMRRSDGLKKQKFGAYQCEREVFEWCRGSLPNSKTLEAQVMDWADDITYVAHDLEDFYRRNAIPTEKLKNDQEERDKVIKRMLDRGRIGVRQTERHGEVLATITELLPEEKYLGSIIQRRSIRALVSFFVRRWVSATGFQDGSLKIKDYAKQEVAVVQELTWQYVIEDPALRALQDYQNRMIRKVFEVLESGRREGVTSGLIPPSYLERIQEATTEPEKTRAIIDLVANMGEDQVINTHRAISDVDWTLA